MKSNLENMKKLSLDQMEQVNGGANRCEWAVGITFGIAGWAWATAGFALFGPVGAFIGGAAAVVASIELGSTC